MKISVVTPSVRPEMLEIVKKCLLRQTFWRDGSIEWIVISPQDYKYGTVWIPDPPKREGDFYNLNKAWNAAFKKAKGELVVSIVDGIWFPPDTLERFWIHYQTNPKACVGAIGHQYDRLENGKPEGLVWRDPRARTDHGSFYEVPETEMELCVASFPRQAVIDIGGFDEEYDRGCAVSEKEAMLRIYTVGYKLYLDQEIVYRAIKHDRVGGSEAWDKGYEIACQLLSKHRKEIAEGKRLKLNYLL